MYTIQQHFQDHIHAPITLDELWITIKSIIATTPGRDGISNLYIKNVEHTRINDTGNMELQHNHQQPTTIKQNITAQAHTQKRQRYHTHKKLETHNTF